MPFDPRVRTVVDGHRATFESLGCIVEQAEPDFAPAEISFRILRAWDSANYLRRAAARTSGRFQGHAEGRDRGRAAADRRGSRARRDGPRPDLAAISGIPRKVRILRSAHHAVAALRHQHAIPDGDRGREVRELHRLDEVLLVYLGDRQSRSLRAGRIHAGRACRWACRSWAATKRTSAFCNWRTPSSRPQVSARSVRPSRRTRAHRASTGGPLPRASRTPYR